MPTRADATAPPDQSRSGAVGYKRPPSEHQFRKGVSGNPKGRPRKPSYPDAMATSVRSLVLAEMRRMVEVRENGVSKKLSVLEAVVRRGACSALTGDGIAQRRFLAVAEKVEREDRQARLEKIRLLAAYKAEWTEKRIEADLSGESFVPPIPHPDDISIDTRRGVALINGPADEIEQAEWDGADRQRKEILAELKPLRTEIASIERGWYRKHLVKQMAPLEETLAELDRRYPAAKVRRKPGFDLHKHRSGK